MLSHLSEQPVALTFQGGEPLLCTLHLSGCNVNLRPHARRCLLCLRLQGAE